MVATLLRIRFRILGNTLASNPWQLVGFVAGAIGGVWLLVAAAIGLVFAGSQGLQNASTAIVAGGAALTLGWVLAPIFAAGVDTTLDPARLAPFPMTTAQMMNALTAAGLTGVPGITTSIGALITFAAWFHWPLAVVAAVVCVPLGVLICVVASRALAAIVGGIGGGRRTRELFALVLFAALMLAGPLISGAIGVVAGSWSNLVGVFAIVSWTPIGAAWAVPGDLAAGQFGAAALKLLIALATLVVLWMLWRRALMTAVVSGSTKVKSTAAAGKLGWFGRVPSTATGATLARSLTYWVRDPRYLRQLLIVPIVPVLVLVWARGDSTNVFITFSATLAAFVVGIVPYADISYDGTAFGTILATPLRGRADRLGRMLAAGAVGLPLVLVLAVVTVWISDGWTLLPAVLGTAIGLLLTAYGVCAVSSAYLVIPVPAAGDSAFKRVPGASFVIYLVFFGIWLATAVLAGPAIGFALYAVIAGSAVAGWIALALGTVMGLVVFVVGIIVGGKALDRTAPGVLSQLHAMKGT